MNLIIYNALLYNTPDSLHGKAAIRLRNGVAPLLAKLDQFDDPNSEIHQKHRRYLDTIDDTYIDNLFRVDYPAPTEHPGPLAGPAQCSVNGIDAALFPRAGVPEILSSADVRAASTNSLGKRKRDEETLDTAAGFRAPKIFTSISELSNHFASSSQAGPSGTAGQADKPPRKSAKVLALEKRRQQNRDYRARVKARKLAEKARIEQEALIAAGSNPDTMASDFEQPQTEHLNDTSTIDIVPAEIAENAEMPTSHDQSSSLQLASLEPALPKVEDDEQEPTVSQAGQEAVSSVSTVEQLNETASLGEMHPIVQSIATPRVNEWGAAIDRVEPPNDHEANLLFNEGWILPAGTKRRRASSANTEISGPIVKGRKGESLHIRRCGHQISCCLSSASLPASSVSPMLPVLSLPASAPSLSMPLPPLAEQSSSPDVPDRAPAEHPPLAAPVSPPVTDHANSVPTQAEQEGGHSLGAHPPTKSAQGTPQASAQLSTSMQPILQKPDGDSDLSEVEESRPASPTGTQTTALHSIKHTLQSDAAQPTLDAAELALDAALADAGATLNEPMEIQEAPKSAVTESELSELDEDEPIVETPRQQDSPKQPSIKEEKPRSKSRSSSVKLRAPARKPASKTNAVTPKPQSKSSPAKRGRKPTRRQQAEPDLADDEDDVPGEAEPEATKSGRRTERTLSQIEVSEKPELEQDATLSPDVTWKKAPATGRSRSRSVVASPEPILARTPVRGGGRKKKGKRGRKPKPKDAVETTGTTSIAKDKNKPSRTISQQKLKEIYSDKPTSFVLERLRLLLPHVRFHSFNEVEDYDLVWARSNKQAPYWPAEVCLDVEERDGDVPQAVLDADPNKQANRQKSEEANRQTSEGANESMSKRPDRVFEHYVLVQWFPQTLGTKSSW